MNLRELMKPHAKKQRTVLRRNPTEAFLERATIAETKLQEKLVGRASVLATQDRSEDVKNRNIMAAIDEYIETLKLLREVMTLLPSIPDDHPETTSGVKYTEYRTRLDTLSFHFQCKDAIGQDVWFAILVRIRKSVPTVFLKHKVSIPEKVFGTPLGDTTELLPFVRKTFKHFCKSDFRKLMPFLPEVLFDLVFGYY